MKGEAQRMNLILEAIEGACLPTLATLESQQGFRWIDDEFPTEDGASAQQAAPHIQEATNER
jgi:hypothetical protein